MTKAERQRIAQRKYQKTPKGIATWKRWNRSAKRKAADRRYLSSPDGQIARYLVDQSPARKLRKRLYMQEARAHGCSLYHRHSR